MSPSRVRPRPRRSLPRQTVHWGRGLRNERVASPDELRLAPGPLGELLLPSRLFPGAVNGRTNDAGVG